MNKKQIEELVEHPQNKILSYLETHISWILFSEDLVFKVKKPVHFSFIDFQTISRRKYYCEQEIKLNSRLAPSIYLDVVPVYEKENHYFINGENTGEVIDYAVKMKRMDEAEEMDKMLARNQVTKHHVKQLAEVLAAFHTKAPSISQPFNLTEAWEDFKDIYNYVGQIETILGRDSSSSLVQKIVAAKDFLDRFANVFTQRRKMGFTIDGHGDLHSGNIFLSEQPLIFDCIEFNNHLRQVDVLDELAFLCLDFDYFGQPELENHFLTAYLKTNPVIPKFNHWPLFYYYKSYRANVRLKVNLIKWNQSPDQETRTKISHYYRLLNKYLDILKSCKNESSEYTPPFFIS